MRGATFVSRREAPNSQSIWVLGLMMFMWSYEVYEVMLGYKVYEVRGSKKYMRLYKVYEVM